jgi:adenosine deaminase
MSDVFDRLKNRARPTVPTRDTSIVKEQDTKILNDGMTEFSHLANSESSDLVINEVKKGDTITPPQEQQEDLTQTFRRTIRLEQNIDTKLDVFCTTQKVTRDTFIEAAFMVCSQNEEFRREVLEEAKKRYHQRKQAGEQRKFQTMAKKINPE